MYVASWGRSCWVGVKGLRPHVEDFDCRPGRTCSGVGLIHSAHQEHVGSCNHKNKLSKEQSKDILFGCSQHASNADFPDSLFRDK